MRNAEAVTILVCGFAWTAKRKVNGQWFVSDRPAVDRWREVMYIRRDFENYIVFETMEEIKIWLRGYEKGGIGKRNLRESIVSFLKYQETFEPMQGAPVFK